MQPERTRTIKQHNCRSRAILACPLSTCNRAIPFGARVVAVADSFDAMTSDRPYRAGMPVGQAARILREGRGIQWDAAIVDALLRVLSRESALAVVEVHVAASDAISA